MTSEPEPEPRQTVAMEPRTLDLDDLASESPAFVTVEPFGSAVGLTFAVDGTNSDLDLLCSNADARYIADAILAALAENSD